MAFIILYVAWVGATTTSFWATAVLLNNHAYLGMDTCIACGFVASPVSIWVECLVAHHTTTQGGFGSAHVRFSHIRATTTSRAARPPMQWKRIGKSWALKIVP